MITSRKIEDLHPAVAKLCRQFIIDCSVQGIKILITSTYRDIAAQDALYAQGRTTPGHKVTNARGGYSYHNYKCAYDFVPLVNGKAQWDSIALFRRCGEIGKALGLEWAGDWKFFRELAHFQYTGGLTLAELRTGKQLT
jgi:peptidoglycan L-alanyl-D-glutamate endopeptidase CwlK